MADLFAKAGLACLIAAIIGGGLKAFSIEFPLLKSGFRQVVLAITGIALMTVGWTNADASTVSDDDARPAPLSPAPDSAAARRPAPAGGGA